MCSGVYFGRVSLALLYSLSTVAYVRAAEFAAAETPTSALVYAPDGGKNVCGEDDVGVPCVTQTDQPVPPRICWTMEMRSARPPTSCFRTPPGIVRCSERASSADRATARAIRADGPLPLVMSTTMPRPWSWKRDSHAAHVHQPMVCPVRSNAPGPGCRSGGLIRASASGDSQTSSRGRALGPGRLEVCAGRPSTWLLGRDSDGCVT